MGQEDGRGSPQMLQVSHEGRLYFFRHLFSGTESWRPEPALLEKAPAREEHSHAVYHMVLYTAGSGSFDLDGVRRHFEPGLLTVTSPWEPHKFGPHADCPMPVEYKNFSFELAGLDGGRLEIPFHQLISLYSGSEDCQYGPCIQLHGEAFDSVKRAFDMAIGLELAPESSPTLKSASAIVELFAKVFLAFSPQQSAKPGGSCFDSRLLGARGLLERDLLGRLDIGVLSKKAGLSGPHLIRAFKKAFGETPARFNKRLRLGRGRRLLAGSDWTEKRIASETGFCDEFHFAKAFKAEFRETPSAFRKRARAARG